MQSRDQEKLEAFKSNYHEIPYPVDLQSRIEAIYQKEKHKKAHVNLVRIGLSTAAVLTLFTIGVNTSQSFAAAMTKLPIIGPIVSVISFKFDEIDTDLVHANVEAPVITGLENKTLEAALNQKYYEESKALYEAFVSEMGEIENLGGHAGIDSGFEIKTDNDLLISIARYVVNTAASSSTTMTYETVDKELGLLLTLPSLFVDDTYIDIISAYLIDVMKETMKNDSSKVYWVLNEDFAPFESIKPNQNFYISDQNKLMISFDKYEVAPGYMGIVEFEIPTDIIKTLLVSDRYIK